MRLIRRQASVPIARSARDSDYEGLQRAEHELLDGMSEFMSRNFFSITGIIIISAQRDAPKLEAASVAADLDDVAEAVSVGLAAQKQNAKAGNQQAGYGHQRAPGQGDGPIADASEYFQYFLSHKDAPY